jgi:hypothetical protein
MAHELKKGQQKQAGIKVHELLSNNGSDDQGKVNARREEFLALLKKQYGYTNEKAVIELERLLRQFYKMNRSIGIYQSRTYFKRPRAGKSKNLSSQQ